MKKILALILSFVFVISFSACKDKEKANTNKVDIEYFANIGKIPESQFALGDKGDDIKKALEEKHSDNESEDSYFDVIEGEKNVLITDGTYEYYYKKASAEKEIAYIVSYSDAYGFKLGDALLEVKNSLKNYEIKEENVTADNLFFYMGDIANSNMITVEFEKNTVIFVFENNALCATVIFSSENWK